MKIPTKSGQIIDTDKLKDVDAAVFEKLGDINNFFTSFKVPYIIRFISHDSKVSGTQSYDHPTLTREEVVDLLMGQCQRFIERSLPDYKVTIRVEPKEEPPGQADQKRGGP